MGANRPNDSRLIGPFFGMSSAGELRVRNYLEPPGGGVAE
jgi:hypothetical protein